jgi:hypothetical protein
MTDIKLRIAMLPVIFMIHDFKKSYFLIPGSLKTEMN